MADQEKRSARITKMLNDSKDEQSAILFSAIDEGRPLRNDERGAVVELQVFIQALETTLEGMRFMK
jgi:hypothetical protein